MTRELLSEVLEVYVYELDFIQDNKQFFKFTSVKGSEDYQVDNINIYELVHKCKEWATKSNFHLISYTISYEAVEKKGYCQTHHTQDESRESDKPFHADTEPEAIFKACEWILEQKEIEL